MTDFSRLRKAAERVIEDEHEYGDWSVNGEAVLARGDIYLVCDGLREEDAEFVAAADPNTIIRLINELQSERNLRIETERQHMEALAECGKLAEYVEEWRSYADNEARRPKWPADDETPYGKRPATRTPCSYHKGFKEDCGCL